MSKQSTDRQMDSAPNRFFTRWLGLAVLILALLPRLLSPAAFLTADEDDQLLFAARFLGAVEARDWAGALVLGYPGVPTQAVGAVGIRLYDAWQAQPFLANLFVSPPNPPVSSGPARYVVFLPLISRSVSPPDWEAQVQQNPLAYLRVIHSLLAILYTGLVGLIFVLLYYLLGKWPAFVAAVIIAFDPFILAHSRVMHVDAPLAYFMIISFLAFIIFLQNGRYSLLVLSAVTAALAVLSKTPGVVLFPILAVAGAIMVWLNPANRKVQTRRLIGALLAWSLMAGLAFVALWPSMWSRPLFALQIILGNIISVGRSAHPTSGRWWGLFNSDQNPLYYLIAVPFHLTPFTLVGALAALAIFVWAGYLRRVKVAALPVALGLAAYSAVFVAAISISARRGDRYALPIFFALDILAAWGWCRLARPKLARGLIIAALILQAVWVVKDHPGYLAYTNPLVGGSHTAPRLINIGWGEGLDQAAAYLNQKPNAADFTVAAWYSWQFAPYFHGRTVDLSSNEPALTADYTVFYINQLQRGFPGAELLAYFADRAPEKIITLGGIDYAWIYPGPIIGEKPPAALATPVNAPLHEAITLLGVDAPAAFNRQPEAVPVTLYWQVNNNLPADLNVSIRLRGADGALWGQVDRFPIGGLVRTQNWPAGQIIRDEYALAANPAVPPGIYTLDILLYRFADGAVLGQVNGVGAITVTAPKTPVKVKALAAWHTDQGASLVQNAASLGDDVRLLANTPLPAGILPGVDLPLTLYWQARRAPRADHAVTVLAQSADGAELPLWSGPVGSAENPVSTWKRGQLLAQRVTAAFPADAPPGDYTLVVRVDESGATASLGRISLGQYPHTFTRPDNLKPLEAIFGEPPQIRLPGYTVNPSAGELVLTLYWQAETVQSTNYQVFIHLTNAAGEIIAQHDAAPSAGARPTRTWLPGEVIADEHSLAAPAADYTIWVGLYNPVDGARLPVMADGLPVSDNRLQLGE